MNSKEENNNTFVPITSKNSASGLTDEGASGFLPILFQYLTHQHGHEVACFSLFSLRVMIDIEDSLS